MTDPIERRLGDAGRRWRAGQPPPPAVPLARLGERLPRRRPRALLAAAAAVVLLCGAGAYVARSWDGAHSAGPAGTSGPHTHRADPVVPWRDLPAGHPHVGHRVRGHMVTPFDNVMAGGTVSGHLRPGAVLRFVVRLESYAAVPLAPCPDYTVAIGAGYARTWRLNCAAVPFRARTPGPGGRWYPVLPARRSVAFAMRVRVPDEPGRQKVLWTLDGPTAMPGFYGIVTIGR